jgi:uncharacterized PurR-regulated membrane protein YhhQ (DUF165 family)
LPPWRTIITLGIVLGLAALALWTVVALPRYRGSPLMRSQRTALTVFVVAAVIVAIGWLAFILPAYWD